MDNARHTQRGRASSLPNPLSSISIRAQYRRAVRHNEESIRSGIRETKGDRYAHVSVCADGQNHCLVKGKSPVMAKHRGTVGFVGKIWCDISRQRRKTARGILPLRESPVVITRKLREQASASIQRPRAPAPFAFVDVRPNSTFSFIASRHLISPLFPHFSRTTAYARARYVEAAPRTACHKWRRKNRVSDIRPLCGALLPKIRRASGERKKEIRDLQSKASRARVWTRKNRAVAARKCKCDSAAPVGSRVAIKCLIIVSPTLGACNNYTIMRAGWRVTFIIYRPIHERKFLPGYK